MPAEIIEIECPSCGCEFEVPMREFVDAQEDPTVKKKIIEGEFFLNACPDCGDQMLVEYPVMYTDPEKKLNVYLAPGHEEDLLDQMNSLDIPPVDDTADVVYRVVGNGVSLMEKILLAENGRDDRVMELYKFTVWDQVQDEWPDLEPGDLLYMYDEDGEYLVIWTSDNGEDEMLSIELDEELYQELAKNYLQYMEVPATHYAEVDQYWIRQRFERGEE